MIKILVTGSKGQLGSELQLLAPNYQDMKFIFHDVDTLDITTETEVNTIFDQLKPDFIINCAAYTAVDKAETEIELAHRINAQAVGNLTSAASRTNARLLHISTDYVFDGTSHVPYNENDPVNPQSAYGRSKLAGETEAIKDPRSLVIRTSWLYSTFGNNFVKTIIRLASERPELKIIFDQVGSPTYAADLAACVIHIIHQIKNKHGQPGGIYHYSNEGVCSWYDFACKIVSLKDLTSCKVYPIETFQYPLPAKRPQYSVFNKAKIKNTFGIEIPWWEESLKNCIQKL